MALAEVTSLVNDSITSLKSSPYFVSWRDSEKFADGDILLINNSFVFRDVKTNKADAYLAFAHRPADTPIPLIARGARFNSDFKRMAAASSNLPILTPLADNLPEQMGRLGYLVFLLIGQVQDTELLKCELGSDPFVTAAWDPVSKQIATVAGDTITVSRTDDEELVWDAVHEQLIAHSIPIPVTLRDAIGIALDKLQDQAVARVTIPQPGAKIAPGITDAILTVLREQRDEYASATASCMAGAGTDSSPINHVLRIAYNFASDATTYLRLIVSICDLKPIVLWGTIAEHVALSTAFHALPWSRSKQKPSLKNYQQVIGDARNSAFHNLFPFRKSLRVSLPEIALGSPELQIFSEHSKRSQNQLTYQDRELVDVLIEFTRARERSLPMGFWTKNLEVMNTTIKLFERTNEFVKALARAREP